MRKKFVFFLLIICMLGTTATVASGRASAYLESYAVQLQSMGRSSMSIDMSVDGTRVMSRIGVLEILIEEKNTSTSSWHEYKTLSSADDLSQFYTYNSMDYMKTMYFDGVPGRYYRVTITAHAYLEKVGQDTGTVTSTTVLCK